MLKRFVLLVERIGVRKRLRASIVIEGNAGVAAVVAKEYGVGTSDADARLLLL